MRIVLVLVALLIVGLLVFKQMDKAGQARHDMPEVTEGVAAPVVPTKPQDVQTFGQDVNQFMDDAATERARQMDKVEQ